MSFSKSGGEEEEKAFPSRFLVSFQEKQGKEELLFEWKQEEKFSITDFCGLFGFKDFELPEFLNISIAHQRPPTGF